MYTSPAVHLWYNSAMGKKRLIVDLDEAEHGAVSEKARAAKMSVANYVRRALDLPPVKWGVKRAEPAKKAAAASAKVRAKKAKRKGA
jgi:hypothetical protein